MLCYVLRASLANQDQLEHRAFRVSVATRASLAHQVKEVSQVTLESQVER